jgi:hypothetical protein
VIDNLFRWEWIAEYVDGCSVRRVVFCNGEVNSGIMMREQHTHYELAKSLLSFKMECFIQRACL